MLNLALASAALALNPAPAQSFALPMVAPIQESAAFDRKRRDRRAYEQGYRDGRQDQRINGDTRIWRGRDNRYYCRRDDGTTGLLIGAAAGAVIGNQVAGGGDKTLGTILGGLGGAFIGREIDRDKYRCR